MKTFSIITTTLNREKYLQQCLDSVKQQTNKDFEHIIIDGYSTDSTPQIIEQYIKDNPELDITYKQLEPKGVYNAFNYGIKLAKGKFINFLNSDDYYYDETTLQTVSNITKANPNTQWIQSKYRTSLENNKLNKRETLDISQNTLETLHQSVKGIRYVPISHQAQFITKATYDQVGLFDEKFKIVSDYDMMFRIAKAGIQPILIEHPLAVIRNHKESLSNAGRRSIIDLLLEGWRHDRKLRQQEKDNQRN